MSAGFFEGAEPLELSLIEMGFDFVEGFSRPDWKLVRHSIQDHFPEEKWPQAWREAGIKWVTQLRDDLGGNYRQYESWNFLLLSSETEENSQAMLRMAENTIDSLEAILGSVGSGKRLMGKRVLLVFGEDDDYYSYISYYYSEGQHSQTAGIFIHRDYAHVALPFFDLAMADQVITHEVTHNYLWGLRIPIWLNEGLSQRMEREIRPNGRRSQNIILTQGTGRRTPRLLERTKHPGVLGGSFVSKTGRSQQTQLQSEPDIVRGAGGTVGRFPGFRPKC